MMATRHTAIVTGANHGIGAATAQALAGRGCAVLCTFLRVDDPDDPGTPQAIRDHRAQDAAAVIARIRDGGGRAAAVEADLSDPATPAMLFATAEEQFGPVDILINNATGSLADTFAAAAIDRLGRSLQPVTAETWTRQFTVDAMGAALMISEFARRHIARQATWGRIIGLTSGGDLAGGCDVDEPGARGDVLTDGVGDPAGVSDGRVDHVRRDPERGQLDGR